jgi:hypothetical protein
MKNQLPQHPVCAHLPAWRAVCVDVAGRLKPVLQQMRTKAPWWLIQLWRLYQSGVLELNLYKLRNDGSFWLRCLIPSHGVSLAFKDIDAEVAEEGNAEEARRKQVHNHATTANAIDSS